MLDVTSVQEAPAAAPAPAPGGPRLSVLDRSSIREGQDPSRAVRETVEFARAAEELGYHRFWVSEHHGVPGLAGPAPAVLAMAVAERTSSIRVGTGGVMLPNHRPLAVAEQFGVLEALHPGRIDMGLGRSLAFTSGIRRALGTGRDSAADFPERLAELLGYFTGDQHDHPGVRAYPGEGLRPSPFLLGTGEGSAELAGRLGLALVTAPVRGEDAMAGTVARYREAFRPSVWGAEPYVAVSLGVAVAPTGEQARRLLVPEAWAQAYSRTRGVFPPLEPAERAAEREMTPRQREYLEESVAAGLYGTPDRVRAELARLTARVGAEEVLVTLSTYDRAEMLDSYRMLAEAPAPAR
ncbi:LLM class flavin-dependent oxidoreductase [Nocardiopsis sp. CNT-189]